MVQKSSFVIVFDGYELRSFGQYKYKHSLSEDEPWKVVHLSDDETEPQIDLPSLLKPVGNGKPIDSKKLADLQKLLCFVPSSYQSYYMSLTDSGNKEDTGSGANRNKQQKKKEQSAELQKKTRNALKRTANEVRTTDVKQKRQKRAD